MSTFASRTVNWFKGHVPTREELERNRWIKPFAKHVLRSDLWRFNRRSVPRGMALGLFVGIMIPLAHFITATLLAVFVRANIPVALAATFIGFPAFLPVIVYAADRVGNFRHFAPPARAFSPESLALFDEISAAQGVVKMRGIKDGRKGIYA